MPVLMNPDCLDQKHRSCSGDGWCESTDQAVPCPCHCHAPESLTQRLVEVEIPGVPLNRLSEHSINLMATRNDPPRTDGQHYDGCPCPVCVTIRAAQPTHTAMQAKHLSGASIGKLVQHSSGRSITTNEHLWSPTAKLTAVWHAENSVEISVDYDLIHDFADTFGQIGLKPDDWVRVTQVSA